MIKRDTPLTTYFFIEEDNFEGFVDMIIKQKEVISVRILDVETAPMDMKGVLMEFETCLDAIYFGIHYQKACNIDTDDLSI